MMVLAQTTNVLAQALNAQPAASTNSVPDSGLMNFLNFLNGLYGLPGHTLVALSCIVFGYCLRLIKKFPNDGIPLACVLFGMVVNPMIQDSAAVNTSVRVWIVKNILIGAIVGALAWLVHRVGLKRIETKFPLLGGLLLDAEETKP